MNSDGSGHQGFALRKMSGALRVSCGEQAPGTILSADPTGLADEMPPVGEYLRYRDTRYLGEGRVYLFFKPGGDILAALEAGVQIDFLEEICGVYLVEDICCLEPLIVFLDC